LIIEYTNSAAKHTNIPKSWVNYIQQPRTSVTVNFPVETRNNEIELITGTRIIHSNHNLPSKGGLRFSIRTSPENLEALAANTSYKAALHNIPFGGAKGCIYIDPTKYTYEEKVRIVRRFTVELWKRSMIGASTDVMGVDIGTDDKMMNIIKDTYKSVISNNSVEVDAVVTGKGVSFGGIKDSKIASGYATARIAKYIQENVSNKVLATTRLGSGGSTKSIILHGLTNNSINFINSLPKNDFKVIGVVDGDHGCFNSMGFNINDVEDYKKKFGTLKGISKNLNNPKEILSKKCDIYVPCKEHIVDKTIAENIQCKLVIEASNFPMQSEALQAFKERNIMIIPDLLSYSGGYIISYLEWLKNLEHRNLTLLFKRFEGNSINMLTKMLTTSDFGVSKEPYKGPEESDLILTTLEEIIDNSFNNVLGVAEDYNIDLRDSCYMIAMTRIFETYKSTGGISI